MRYISSAERIGIEQGLKQGREQGLEQGRKESIGLSKEMFLFTLKNKYFQSHIPQNVTNRVQAATQQELKNWFEKFLAGEFEVAELE